MTRCEYCGRSGETVRLITRDTGDGCRDLDDCTRYRRSLYEGSALQKQDKALAAARRAPVASPAERKGIHSGWELHTGGEPVQAPQGQPQRQDAASFLYGSGARWVDEQAGVRAALFGRGGALTFGGGVTSIRLAAGEPGLKRPVEEFLFGGAGVPTPDPYAGCSPAERAARQEVADAAASHDSARLIAAVQHLAEVMRGQ